MRKTFITAFFFTLSMLVCAQQDLQEDSDRLSPNLEEVTIFGEDGMYRYRAVLYRGGYGHVSAFLYLQKFAINFDNPEVPYELIGSMGPGELNGIYNMGMESIEPTEGGFVITLAASHSYMFMDTVIKLFLSDTLEYEILSGLIELE